MLLMIILLLSLATIPVDIVYFYRRRHKMSIRGWRLLALLTALTDTLPILLILQGLCCPDNTQGLMDFAAWALYIWILTVPSRMAFYFFEFIHLKRLGMIIVSCVVIALIWGATLGRTTLRVSEVEICSKNIPESFEGFRILQLTDMHVGSLVNRERELTRIIERANALNPDLIVFCGDLINIRTSELDAQTLQLLSKFKAPYGVYSVTGNHDSGVYVRDTLTSPVAQTLRGLIDAQRSAGWRVLEDTTVYLRRGNDSISLSGISFDLSLAERRHDAQLPPANLLKVYQGVPDSLFNITLAHLPQLWPQILTMPYGDLTLSGHVHSMQLKLSLFGHSWSPARFIYKHWSGRYDDQGRTLYINDGTGYVAFPMRLGAYPEISVFTLNRCE